MKPQGTLILNRKDVASLLSLPDYLEIVENAFRLHAQRRTLDLGLLHIDSRDGEFHIKAGGLELSRTYFGVKVNGGFFQNRERYGMPNIQGTIILCDGENGYPLAYMDSGAITINRTGATTAVAAKYLAKPDSRTVTICGCGIQGRVHLRAIKHVIPLEEAYAYDTDAVAAERFAEEMSQELGVRVTAQQDAGGATLNSDVCITCTPSREYFIEERFLPAGIFVAAVGADSPEKQEIEPSALASNTVVVDILDQCAEVGELHHALSEGLVTRDAVHAELGEVILGTKPGRSSEDEIIIFDATGTALQDAAGAAAAYERALASGAGVFLDLLTG